MHFYLGFAVLIEKEWLGFSHCFRMRLFHGKTHSKETDRSPQMMQFIDAVWQIQRQFPTSFEFNENFLICICDHMYSGRFGTFLDNLCKERVERRRQETTESIWTYLFAKHRVYRFKNLYYRRCDDCIWPSGNGKRLVLWERYYLRWDPSLWPVAPQSELDFIDSVGSTKKTALSSEQEKLIKEAMDQDATDQDDNRSRSFNHSKRSQHPMDIGTRNKQTRGQTRG